MEKVLKYLENLEKRVSALESKLESSTEYSDVDGILTQLREEIAEDALGNYNQPSNHPPHDIGSHNLNVKTEPDNSILISPKLEKTTEDEDSMTADLTRNVTYEQGISSIKNADETKESSTCRLCRGNHRTKNCENAKKKLQIGTSNRNHGKTDTQTSLESKTALKNNTPEKEITEPVHNGEFEWTIRPHRPNNTSFVYHSGVFYTGTPGYRMQLKAEFDRLHGDVYLAVRVMRGKFDNSLLWPLNGRINIQIGRSGQCRKSFLFPEHANDWKCPHNGVLYKPTSKKEIVISGFHGPFSVSQFMKQKYLKFYCFVDI